MQDLGYWVWDTHHHHSCLYEIISALLQAFIRSGRFPGAVPRRQVLRDTDFHRLGSGGGRSKQIRRELSQTNPSKCPLHPSLTAGRGPDSPSFWKGRHHLPKAGGRQGHWLLLDSWSRVHGTHCRIRIPWPCRRKTWLARSNQLTPSLASALSLPAAPGPTPGAGA